MASADMNWHPCLEGKKINIRLYCISLNLQKLKIIIWCVQGPYTSELFKTEKKVLCRDIMTKPKPLVAFKALAPIKMKLLSAISKSD